MKSLSLFDLAFLAVSASAGLAIGTLVTDNAQSYSDGAGVNGLNGGTGWAGAWSSRIGNLGIIATDDAQTYSDGVSVDGLSGGDGWAGNWVSR